jgi:addiction module HigA family antidote
MPKSSKLLDPILPGEILWEEFMVPLGITQNRLARDIDVPANRIHEIVKGKRAISADTALRFGQYFNTSAEFWLGLQMDYDMRQARQNVWPKISHRIRPLEQAS